MDMLTAMKCLRPPAPFRSAWVLFSRPPSCMASAWRPASGFKSNRACCDGPERPSQPRRFAFSRAENWRSGDAPLPEHLFMPGALQRRFTSSLDPRPAGLGHGGESGFGGSTDFALLLDDLC